MTRPVPAGGARRLPSGGDRIDRDAPLRFEFEGVDATPGSAATRWPPRCSPTASTSSRPSIYDGRPRGIMTAGAEEPNALVPVRSATAEEPMLRATQVELVDGLVAWGLPGPGPPVGRPGSRPLRQDVHPLRRPRRRRRAGGPGARPLAAARDGDRVLLVDEGPVDRGRRGARGVPGGPRRAPGRRRSACTTTATSSSPSAPPTPRSRAGCGTSAPGRIVLATGAIERPIVFAGDDRPGVMLGLGRRGLHAPLRRPGRDAGPRSSRPTTRPTRSPPTWPRPASRSWPSSTRGRGEAIVGTGGDATGRLDCGHDRADGRLRPLSHRGRRPAARLGRLEPQRQPVEPVARHAPLRRAARRVRPRRAVRGGRGGRGRGRRRPPDRRRRCGSFRPPTRTRPTPGRPTTSTSSATPRWPTSGARSAPG